MSVQGLVYFLDEVIAVFMQFYGSFLEGHADRAVAAVVNIMARSLVGKQINVEILFYCCFEQVYDIAVISDGDGLPGRELFASQLEDCIDIIHDHIHPALVVSGLDSGKIYFRENTDRVGDIGCLWLCAAHAAKS